MASRTTPPRKAHDTTLSSRGRTSSFGRMTCCNVSKPPPRPPNTKREQDAPGRARNEQILSRSIFRHMVRSRASDRCVRSCSTPSDTAACTARDTAGRTCSGTRGRKLASSGKASDTPRRMLRRTSSGKHVHMAVLACTEPGNAVCKAASICSGKGGRNAKFACKGPGTLRYTCRHTHWRKDVHTKCFRHKGLCSVPRRKQPLSRRNRVISCVCSHGRTKTRQPPCTGTRMARSTSFYRDACKGVPCHTVLCNAWKPRRHLPDKTL
mmetsp:Transcript_29602/g.94806  ORF Transcript_29602/g.94806 Transcript_29602/m.94806 type:complete len:266 (+) Transcript_29602:1028-1825(+)